MLSGYKLATLIKSLKSSQNFDENVVIILVTFFQVWVTFFSTAKNIKLRNLKFAFSKHNLGTLKFKLAILPYLKVT